jgi:hypothetical protein
MPGHPVCILTPDARPTCMHINTRCQAILYVYQHQMPGHPVCISTPDARPPCMYINRAARLPCTSCKTTLYVYIKSCQASTWTYLRICIASNFFFLYFMSWPWNFCKINNEQFIKHPLHLYSAYAETYKLIPYNNQHTNLKPDTPLSCNCMFSQDSLPRLKSL